ncbi:ABC transporter ATPase [Clostridium perfringens]|uniref:ABC transporter ATPase n=1 Tax=Clostridium perfringens TaxID=1502 RepID=UPI001CB5F5A1|nr:ABC transporter ATPase [Clostridium perfringens]ELC8419246.1 ABC transporter ATPase [Clostridium perfringens]MCX0360050.1 ABC transporter ATPase [Clostridium perfringens]HBI6884379.1 ABC transporter ATPase [Clostridium perfringens]HBI6893377.1 ABC transporter ATPase [Clostridium perfringens]HBI6908173.1 ABC transporter ATPase [Clostridium perfringens]
MENLNTIQKREKLNEVVILDEKGSGGANHRYEIVALQPNSKGIVNMCTIQFQKGARKEEESQHGVIDSDLLEIVRHRLQCFQEGPFSSEYNEKALEHIELALMYMNRRVEDRIERNVLGTYNK